MHQPRKRLRRPPNAANSVRRKATTLAIASSLLAADANGHAHLYLKPRKIDPLDLAERLIRAVGVARTRGAALDRHWQAYVALYDALENVGNALETVFQLPTGYRLEEETFESLRQQLSELTDRNEAGRGVRAQFTVGNVQYVFEGTRRGRANGYYRTIALAAAVVWYETFDKVPSPNVGGTFAEVLSYACDYYKEKTPSAVALKSATEACKQLVARGGFKMLRFYQKNLKE
jgi:hypothetical protein